MTTIAAAYNKNGIAIAGDSAATRRFPDGNIKIYNANKIFRLSNINKIGIAIYQNSEFGGLPRETLIKVYRENNKKRFNHLKDQINDFCKFLVSSDFLLETNTKDIFIQFAYNIQRQWNLYIQSLIQYNKFDQNENYFPIFIKNLSNDQNIIKTVAYIKNNKITFENKLFKISDDEKNELKQIFLSIFNDGYGNKLSSEMFDHTSETLFNLFEKLCSENLSFLNNYTGLVFFGFGENEYTPKIYSLKLYLKKDSGLWITDNVDHSEESSAICGFADLDMIVNYINGINPQLEHNISICTANSKDEIQMRTKITSLINKYKQSQVNDLLSSMSNFSIDELGNEVETFVKLSSFRKRMSKGPETVGGDIDVAVITKGDGFIWIKRKHYFKREYNEHYFNQK